MKYKNGSVFTCTRQFYYAVHENGRSGQNWIDAGERVVISDSGSFKSPYAPFGMKDGYFLDRPFWIEKYGKSAGFWIEGKGFEELIEEKRFKSTQFAEREE